MAQCWDVVRFDLPRLGDITALLDQAVRRP
jgi:hypothetical protein